MSFKSKTSTVSSIKNVAELRDKFPLLISYCDFVHKDSPKNINLRHYPK